MRTKKDPVDVAASIRRSIEVSRKGSRRVRCHTLRDLSGFQVWSAEVSSVPWLPLGQLFGAFADIRGVGVSKMTKALYPKRPALIPMLDSMVQAYLRDDDPAPGSRSQSARSDSSAATNATCTATRWQCKRGAAQGAPVTVTVPAG